MRANKTRLHILVKIFFVIRRIELVENDTKLLRSSKSMFRDLANKKDLNVLRKSLTRNWNEKSWTTIRPFPHFVRTLNVIWYVKKKLQKFLMYLRLIFFLVYLWINYNYLRKLYMCCFVIFTAIYCNYSWRFLNTIEQYIELTIFFIDDKRQNVVNYELRSILVLYFYTIIFNILVSRI